MVVIDRFLIDMSLLIDIGQFAEIFCSSNAAYFDMDLFININAIINDSSNIILDKGFLISQSGSNFDSPFLLQYII